MGEGHISCRFLNDSDDIGHFLHAMRSRVKLIRFRLEETSQYICTTTDYVQLERMEQEKSFRVNDVVFTVPKDKDLFTIVLETDAPKGFPRTSIGGCPWRFKDSAAQSLP